MTEEIDLDELDVDRDDEPDPNPGDWFWRGDGDPAAEPDPMEPAADTADTDAGDVGGGEGPDGSPTGGDSGDGPTARVPHVPRENKDKPVGIPIEGGGAGARAAPDAAEEPPDHDGGEDGDTTAEASGPHGGDTDEMTMALTYEAMKRLENPQRVVADANAWADWIGIVGDVESFVINKFQRDNRVDVDFFNGSSQGPAERLAAVDETSMFYAGRMVLVGLPGEEWMAEAADWEFVPLSEAAGKADWARTDEESG
jgi:hypothetical protein